MYDRRFRNAAVFLRDVHTHTHTHTTQYHTIDVGRFVQTFKYSANKIDSLFAFLPSVRCKGFLLIAIRGIVSFIIPTSIRMLFFFLEYANPSFLT